MSEEMNQLEVKNYEVGDIVKGKITKVEEKQVIVDINDCKLDGIIPISELSSLHIEKPSDVVSEGDDLELEVIKTEDEALILSKRKVDAKKAWVVLKQKAENNETIEAEVKDIVKGGLVVDLGVRGFIPASLVETFYVEDFSDYKGKKMTFKIVELDEEKNRLILSHRAIVEEELKKKKEEFINSLEIGQVIEGTVERLTDFGAFVDIGGVDGLVHISQMSYEHIDKPSDVVSVGDKVKVKVLNVDKEKQKISLSIKATLPGPWENISEKAPKNSILKGVVKRIVSYGAFVEVFPGVEGLVHISQMSNKHIATPNEVIKEGQEVEVKVLDVNEQEKRLSLSMKDLEEKPKEKESYKSYEFPEESKGFQLGEMIGDQLKKLQN